uniref:STAS domain-containing protein n=1 Tax=Leptobrachium leishanense TaxID=445787 RepID=A0A8C5MX21_9ANUR
MDSMESYLPDKSERAPSIPFTGSYVELKEQNKALLSPRDLIFDKTKHCCTTTPKRLCIYIFHLFPVLQWLPKYNFKEYLLGDIVSGLIVGIVTIPQAIAYSLLASQDPIYGLYSNFFCCIIYFFMGTSRHNCVGTFGVLCLMIGESVNKQLRAAGFSEEGEIVFSENTSLAANMTVCGRSCYAIKVATALTFIAGLYQIIMGILRLGFISMYLSEPLLSGFVAGSSLTIVTSQMKYLLGLSIPRRDGAGSLVMTWIDIFANLGRTNICDLVTSMATLAVMIPVKEINERYKSKMKIPFPIELFIIIVTTLVSHYFDFKSNYNSSICGTIPTGFKAPTAPDWSLIPKLATDAIPIAIIGFTMTVSLAELFAKKHGYTVRINQEVIAVGMCNFIPSFFYSFATCAALAKTLLKESTGANTQVNGVITSILLLLVLLAIAPLFYSLQNCILGVITIVSLGGPIKKFADTPKMWQVNKIDTIVWWVTMLASSLISTEIGLLVGVCFSMLCVIVQTQRPRATLLGKVSGTEIYEDQFTYKELQIIPNIQIYRFGSSLYYANKDYFKSTLFSKTSLNPTMMLALQRKAKKMRNKEVLHEETKFTSLSKFRFIKATSKPHKSAETCVPPINIHTLIIDCGAMQFIDTVGLGVLKELRIDYSEIGVHVYLANCNPLVRRLLHNGGYFINNSGVVEQLVFHSVHDAVRFSERKFRRKLKMNQIENDAISTDQCQGISEEY